MHLYETITIFDPNRTDEDINETVEKTTSIITGAGGEILKTDHWGRRKMAYELNKHEKGYYVLMLYRTPSETIKKIEDTYKVNDQIIKYMVIKLNKKQTEGALKVLSEAEAAKAAAETKAATEATEGAESTETAETPATEATTAESEG